MEYTLTDIELIDVCLNAIYDRPATHLGSKFPNNSKEQRRIQALMEYEGLIDLVEGSRVDKSALITGKGKMIRINHGSFKKYLEHVQANESEIKKKAAAAEAREDRNTKVNERTVVWTGLNTLLTIGMFLLAVLAYWQTLKANDKDKVIENQKQHIQQLQERIK